MKRLTGILALFLIFVVISSRAQTQIIDKDNSTITVSGTSTLHDWTIDAEEFESSAEIRIDEGKIDIRNLKVTIKVKGLKSGKSTMDNNTYKAMKSKKFPEIKYEFKEAQDIKKTTGGYLLNTNGTLVIAGVTRDCQMEVKALTAENMNFSGSVTFKMSDYKIDPPTALLGTIKTGDEVTVNFNVKYKPN